MFRFLAMAVSVMALTAGCGAPQGAKTPASAQTTTAVAPAETPPPAAPAPVTPPPDSNPLASPVYAAGIPGPIEGLGHDFGAEITPPEAAIAYLRALAETAPERMRVFDYATSWEGRPLAYAVIARPEIIADLDAVRADLARLADPRGLAPGERDRLIADLPAVVWLSYGVHGDEISSTDAGLRMAYHLLAAQDDPIVEAIFENTIVIVDPVQNPDGRARFLHSFTAARGLEPAATRFAAEHDQPWPGGRTNHYLFDMNRDWFTMSQPETIGRVRAMQEWWPVVVVDAHEMSGDSSYFFAPSAEPFNPQITADQRAAQDLIGRNHARWFDTLGYTYYTREIFDAFYPGYGDMWPTLHGAVAMTYEQASARGLVWRRRDGSLLTYRDGVDRHFVASLSTAEVVANNRARFLRDFAGFRSSAANDAAAPQAILLDASVNRWGAERLARTLAAQGVEVRRVSPQARACGRDFGGEAFLVRFNQPAGRLARTLLEPDTRLPEAFMAEQEARRARGLDHELYDVTAWSLPLMFNVGSAVCASAPRLDGDLVDPAIPLAATGAPGGAFGYAIPWSDAGQARFIAALAREGVAMRTSQQAFRIGDRRYPRGSVVVARHGADEELDTLIARLAAESGGRYDAMESSWVDEGPNPGSDNFRPVLAPCIAMAWGDGTNANSAGPTRFILERRYGLPVTVIRTSRLASARLTEFDVVILPAQSGRGYSTALGAAGAAALQRYAEQGGVVIGLGDATRWLAEPSTGLLPLRRERAAGGRPPGGPPESAMVDGVVIEDAEALRTLEMPRGASPDTAPGALLRVTANPDAWLSAGYDGGAYALTSGPDIYTVAPMDEVTTALRFAAPDVLLAAGYLWEENRAQLAFKPFLVSRRAGSGHVIGFTQDPTSRAYQEGLDLALLNAVILGPAHATPLR